MGLILVVDNSHDVRSVRIDRDKRGRLADIADRLRTLAAIADIARQTESPESSTSYTALGYAVAQHLRDLDPEETRGLALHLYDLLEAWDAGDERPLRPAPEGATA